MKGGVRILICFVYCFFFQIKLVYFLYKVLFFIQPTKSKKNSLHMVAAVGFCHIG